MSSGLSIQLVNLGGSLNKVGEVDQYHQEADHDNTLSHSITESFPYKQTETQVATLTIENTVNFEFSTTIGFNVGVASGGMTFKFGMDFSTTTSTSNSISREWGHTTTVDIPAHRHYFLDCWLRREIYAGNYTLALRVSGPVLVVVWNPDGTSYHPWFVYTSSDAPNAHVENLLPHGYMFTSELQTALGADVNCRSTETKATALKFIEGGFGNYTV